MDLPLATSTSASSTMTKMNITSPTSVLAGAASASAPVGRTTPSPSSSASSNPPLPASVPAMVPTFNSEVDPQIIEALRSKDRIYVLKLGEQFEGLIKERRTRVELTPATSYQRLLVHRCSAYYKLQPENDSITKALYVVPTSESRIPERRICELVPAESNNQPSFKIMKRAPDRRKPHSHAGSIAGEDADLSDVEPSEAGSLGGQSSITSGSTKKRMTIEQREAAYNEARSRIFMGFEEKEKTKDKDMSASSSSLSVSGSTSTSAGGRSSAGDTDEMVSSPATESEWSTPSATFVRDKRRGGGSGGGASSSRSLRSGGSFRGDGSGSSSRNSRAASPSFSYASLYEPPPTGHAYDGSQHPIPPSVAYHHSPQYGYPYPSPNAGPNPSFMPAYPYYNTSPIPYQSPPPMQHNPSDSASPSGLDPYSPSHQMNYGQPYGWPLLQSPQHPMHMAMPPPPQHQQPPQQQLSQQNGAHPMGPMSPPSHISPPTHTPTYSPYGMAPQHAYSYPINQYYPPHSALSPTGQPGQHPAPPQAMVSPPLLHPGMGMHPHQQMQLNPQPHPSYDMSRNMNLNPMMHMSHPDFNNNNQLNQFGQNQVGASGPRSGLGNGVLPAGNSVNGRPVPARDGSNLNVANGGQRNVQQMPPPANTRSAWSYGPGVSLGGFPTGLAAGGGAAFGGGGNDSVGPRFNNSNNSNRRISGHTNSGGNSRASSNCDDVSSIASSSTTSSSSRRTYTSTTSSQQQHPLPPRPDWAVGMKAQPTLASRHHDQHSLSNSRTMSPISPPRSGDQSLPTNSSGSSSLGNVDDHNSPRNPTSAGFAPPSSLQAVDFPPLTSGGPQEKRGPVATGAWGASRPILSPMLNGNSIASSSVATSPSIPAVEDGKGGEIYTPKLVRRTAPNLTNPQPRSPVANPLVLTAQVASMSLADADVDGFASATQSSSRTAAPPAALA